ncbi:DoxX family protein [Mangrovibacterium diazotrophicum]|uniref:Putative oxidoreductase n=1 Tax=Mangrovibacterium diazotrophicum TaxID=1261403 RepID=A0A419VXA4_9BACT|nr:DoxX family protein [Mangrovibacterium diazotrophicum]RKD87865.1 putative oxidoreductase [Mangrovibacterium diazotrophicum]
MGKKMLGSKSNEFLENLWLLLLRAGSGAFMLTHGVPKLMKLISGDTSFADPFGIGQLPSFVLVVFAEFFCSVLVILGITTRLATIPIIITMAVAAFMIHGGQGFAKQEMALLYLLLFTTILVFGSGRFALGNLIRGN